MFVYLTGERERSNPSHIMYVCPAGDKRTSPEGVPSDWLDEERKPKTFPIEFKHGRASVDEALGRYLVSTNQAAASSLLRPHGRSILGALAERVLPAPRTQF